MKWINHSSKCPKTLTGTQLPFGVEVSPSFLEKAMSYRSYVALAMPKGDWQELKFEGRKLLENNEDCKYEDSIFENIDVTIEFTNPADHNTMWIILRWERILWITLFADFADVTLQVVKRSLKAQERSRHFS
jgi:hypothetical protein